MKICLTARDSMDYYALKREKRSTFGEISEKSPFGKELRTSRLSSMSIFQAKKGAGKQKKKIAADAA
jgi:hypothetical protein